jgi:hypothetical protein
MRGGKDLHRIGNEKRVRRMLNLRKPDAANAGRTEDDAYLTAKGYHALRLY